MHLIIKNNVTELANDFGYTGYKESKLFEIFCNFCAVSKHYLGRFDPMDVTTQDNDASIDGIAIIIDGDLIFSEDDASEAFQTHKTNLAVDIILTQVKSGETFKKSEISNFALGIEDFLSLKPKLPNGEINKEATKVLNVILGNLKKVKGRRPNAHIYYCTSGVYTGEKEIKACFDIIETKVLGTDFFQNITVNPMGRREILKLYENLSSKNEAKLRLIEYFGMQEMPGIPQSYVGVAKASEYVDCLLIDDDRNLKQSVFEENVRSFLGDKEDVNADIKSTLQDKDKKKLFSVLNNGITIVAPEMALTPNTKEISLTNYQIINGCQTSSTLYSNYDELDNSVNVVIKFIESPNNDASEDIISATNSQTDIPKESFYGLREKAKLVQKYFAALNKRNTPENNVYFERRQGEYRDSGHQISRIFDVKGVARCYAAMFLNQPHNSARYVKAIFGNSSGSLFKEDDHESYYYCATLTLYKYQTLINGRKINAHNYLKVRWHIIQMFKWFVHGTMDVPSPNSHKADQYADKLINILNSPTKTYVDIFERCQAIVDTVGFPSLDALKRARFTQDLAEAVKSQLP